MGGVSEEKALARRLQLARRRAGLTQQELCQKAGLSYSTLAKIERGAIKSPSVFTVVAIAAATGTVVEDLLDMPSPARPAPEPKKRSKTGITFVYMDISGTMSRFTTRAFTQIAHASSEPVDAVEMHFWRHHDQVASGRMSLGEFDALMGKELGIKNFSWMKYYMASVEPMPHIKELVEWIAHNYKLGILSNNFPGVIDELRQKKIVPDVTYEAVVDSSKTGHVKPEPQIYALAGELAAAPPAEILLVDNERPNLTAADRAGWKTVRFDEDQIERSVKRIRELLAY